MRVKVEATLKHPVTASQLGEFLDGLGGHETVWVNTFEGDITVRWEEDR